MKIPVIVRLGTAAQASSNNKLLKMGEWGYTTDTFAIKIGRGLAWNDTPGLFDAITSALAGKVAKDGDTMTGILNITKTAAADNPHTVFVNPDVVGDPVYNNEKRAESLLDVDGTWKFRNLTGKGLVIRNGSNVSDLFKVDGSGNVTILGTLTANGGLLGIKFKYSILFPNETEIHGDYCNVSETINSITKSTNIATVEYRTDGGAWKNIATGGNMPFTRVAGTYTDYRITYDLSGNRYGSIIIEGKENI